MTQIVDEVAHCYKRQYIKQSGNLVRGVIGHALKIGLEYMDKIRKGSTNWRGFYYPSYWAPAHKLVRMRIVVEG